MKDVLLVDYDKILWDAYESHGSLIVCFDFDNTVYDYHKVGIDFTSVINLLCECDKLGFQLICHTSNGGDRLIFIKYYLKEVLGLNSKIIINGTTEYDKAVPTTFHTKPYANIYLDDKGGLREACVRLDRIVSLIKIEKAK